MRVGGEPERTLFPSVRTPSRIVTSRRREFRPRNDYLRADERVGASRKAPGRRMCAPLAAVSHAAPCFMMLIAYVEWRLLATRALTPVDDREGQDLPSRGRLAPALVGAPAGIAPASPGVPRSSVAEFAHASRAIEVGVAVDVVGANHRDAPSQREHRSQRPPARAGRTSQ
jgi:hypothetical protein